MQPVTSPTLLVLAAGMGSRYGGLKQLDPVGPAGETIIDYSIYDAIRAGFAKVVFIIRGEIEPMFREQIGARFADRIRVEYALQELNHLPIGFSPPLGRSKPWGTAHAVLMARDVIHESFAVINADDFYGTEGYRQLALHLQSGTTEQAMVGFSLRKTLSDFGTVSRGVCILDDDGYLVGVEELTRLKRDGQQTINVDSDSNITRLSGDELVSMNMWGFTPQVFDWLQEYFERFLRQYASDLHAECFLPDMVNEMMVQRSARVKVLHTQDSWLGITYREDTFHVTEGIRLLVQNGSYPRKLW